MMRSVISILILFFTVSVFAQQERQQIRKGNDLYKDKKYTEAEVAYRKGLEGKDQLYQGKFNLGNAMLKQKKYDEAIQQFQILAQTTEDKKELAKVYHNLGNAYMETKKYAKGAEAYKNSLINNPSDNETRYNLAYAQAMLKQEQQQQQQNQDKPEPSEYAKKLKKQADDLVNRFLFRDALNVMEEGLKVDKTVAAYNDFIDKMKKVTGISE
ncbi:tetratricopeptide repeat protein [Saccharicrinis sp. FJH2]|uniref:tetratricopeptide repeat protein n=1 Tax=Saccharicrinis sp. FJH65 TaxID=3344659 RepID=UPI0035F2A0AE